jgi:NUMOD3 motif
MKPYTYLIGWKVHNKYYYGVRYAINCDPTELMVTYFTSSEEVSKMIRQHGLPDIVQIRRTFDSALNARSLEHKVLRRMKVVVSDKWLNKTDNKSIAPMSGQSNPMYGKIGVLSHRYGSEHTDETKIIIGEKSKKKRGRMPEGFSEKMSRIVSGRTHSEKTKNKISEKLTGRRFSDEHKNNISKAHMDVSGDKNPFFGKKHSDETKEKMKKKRVGLRWIHNKSTDQRVMVQLSEIEHFLNLGWTSGKGKHERKKSQ